MWCNENKRCRHRSWIGLGITFFVIVLAFISVSSGLSWPRQEERAARMVENLGGMVVYDYQWSADGVWVPDAKPPGNTWLKHILGEHYDANVVEVQLFRGRRSAPQKLDDRNAKQLSTFSEVKWLVLMDTNITDKGLKYLKGLNKLERLDLEGSQVTDLGVNELQKALPNVRIFYDGNCSRPVPPKNSIRMKKSEPRATESSLPMNRAS